jgi:hypothetical protein
MQTIAITALKDFARRHLVPCPLLRQMLLEEPEHMDAVEFVIKAKVWLRLLGQEQDGKESGHIRHLHNCLVVRQ